MSTNSGNISALFTAVTTDLIPFYESAVLLPNQALITNSINIEGGAGDSVQFPTQNSFNIGTTIVEGNDVLAAENPFAATAVTITAKKRGSGTYVTVESLEDGQMDVVRGAVVSQLSSAAASATDIAGFKTFINNTEVAPTNANVLVGTDGNILLTNATVGADGGTIDLNVVFSNSAMGYMSKRNITASMEHDVQYDRYIMTGTVRNAFKKLRENHMLAVGSIAGSTASADNATLVDFASAVSTLRANNAQPDASGFYYAAITPQVEYLLSSYINGVSGAGNIGALSDIGNSALLRAVISEAIGLRWLRTNNLVTGVTNTQ